MKFLGFVDFHHDYDDYVIMNDKIKEFEPDFLVCAGDFTWFGDRMKEVLESFLEFDKRIYVIHGNHEEKDEVKEICAQHKNLVFCHKKIIQIEDTTFVFFGGGGFNEKEPEFSRFVKKNSEQLDDARNIILVTHAPPKDTDIDAINEEWHVGVEDFREFIEKYSPVLSISGHIHESYKKQQKLKDTLLINPGGDGEIFEMK